MNKLYMQIGSWTGLGNQMFQYSILQILSNIKNFEIIIEKKSNYLLDNFNVIKKNQKYINNIDCNNKWEEKNYNYDSTLFNINNEQDLEIIGYFQNIDYFVSHKEFILDIFKFENDIIRKYDFFINNLKLNSSSKIIAVHIRLPDWDNEDPEKFLYSFPTLNFLNDSMSLFDLENDIFLIFSNKIERVKKTYSFKSKNIIFISEGLINDLCILTLCDHYILSPSTYGWWGCFLNPKNEKKIIMMSPWFNINAHGKHLNNEINLYFKDSKIYNTITSTFE